MATSKAKKKTIIGASYLINGYCLVLYVLNEQGYQNLIKVSALASKNESVSDYLKDNHQGLLGVLETNYGAFKEKFLQENIAKDVADISNLVDEFFLGIENNTPLDFAYAEKVREFAQEHTYEVVAFPRILYQKKGDALVLRILSAIDKGEKIEEKELEGEQYFKSIETYDSLYNKEEIELTNKILSLSSFELSKKRGEIIRYPVEDSVLTLKRNVFDGLKAKGIADDRHIARAKYELDTIVEMGYEDYFLIVSDYVRYAKEHDILVGPGRGSAAGSLVSYALDITEVDPLDYDLQFERFLNKARKTMPDIDVDFMDTKRDDMIEYLRQKYGVDHVANICTCITIQAKQALRDIGRIYSIADGHIDKLSNSITDKVTLREAYKTLPVFKNLVDGDKFYLEIVSLASKIEGLPRQSGLHAAGVILNNSSLEEVLPVTVDFDGHYTSQYEKDFLESQGFLKMDFLALRNLTIIDYCLELINKRHNLDLDFYHLDFKDENIFKLLRTGQTIGVFQLESSGMKNAIKIMQPSCFEDVATLLAIFRPGPMDNIKNYTDRKKGKIKPVYLSEDLKKILSPTYGVLIYQEQINQIAQVMAGFSPENADLFRRAISHKEKSVLESSKKDFIAGSIKNGYSEINATKMFNEILKFANYGFNKSHAVVYAIIACRMAYLKYYYPLEFYSSILTISSGASDAKFGEYVAELRRRKLGVLLPSINESEKNFIIKENGLLYPLSMIRGVNVDAVNKILDERHIHGPFTDFFNAVSRLYSAGISIGVISKLIDAGTFDIFGKSRATLRATIDYAYQLAELSLDNNGQLIIDETLSNQQQYFETKDDPLLNLNLEYEELGIMLSDNPLNYKKDLLEINHVVPLMDVKDSYGTINIAGIVSNVKKIKSRKNNTTMAFIKIFDDVAELEVVVFARVYEVAYSLLEKNNILLIKGRYDKKTDKESFIADEITLLEEE